MSNLNFNHEKVYTCIHYPGKVKNADKMIETIGGVKTVNEVFNDSNRRLELKFRPKDPNCHVAKGDREKTCSILLKIKRKRKKPGEKHTETDMSAEIMGIVSTSYKFKTLMDFQYLPMVNSGKDDYKSIIPDLLPSNLYEEPSWFDKDGPIFVMPPIFSRLENPQLYNFRRAPKPKSDQPLPVVPPNIIMKTRKFRGKQLVCVNFDDDIPESPDPKSVSIATLHINTELHQQIIKLFETRPIWSRNAIIVILKCEHAKLKNLLTSVAYYMIGGPWRGLWTRFGYDPKINPESKMLQTLDYRVKHSFGSVKLFEYKRISLENTLPNEKSRKNKSYSLDILDNSFDKKESESDFVFETTSRRKLPGIKEELVYKFIPGEIPPFRQMFYQICDIQSEVVQKLAAEDEGSGVCHPKHGWFSEGFFNKCRVELNRFVYDLVSKTLSDKDPKQMEEESDEDEETEGAEYFEGFENDMESELLDYIES